MSIGIESASGKKLDPRYVELSMIMLKFDIKLISFSYSGSGDSGSIDPTVIEPYNREKFETITPDERKQLDELAESIFLDIVYPDFNNSGCYGDANILMDTEGKLSFSCDHHEVIETTSDSTFENELLDTSDL